ncbi:MAG: hypothetical protein KDJ65_26620 [Anaerolineae bacterium]|nr:hypothetical protein [Anaerolineae bacterium]
MNAKEILNHFDEAETIIIEFATKLTVWLAPITAGVLIVIALTSPPLNYPLPVAILIATVVELSGLAFTATALRFFFDWYGAAPPVVSFAITTICTIVYLITALLAVLVAKIAPQFGGVMPALLVILSVSSAVVASVRSSTQRTELTAKPKRTRRRTAATSRKPPSAQSPDERQVNLDRANEARQPTQADYNRAAHLKAEGLTWDEVGEAIGRSGSTAKRWAAQAQPKKEINLNGRGNQ